MVVSHSHACSERQNERTPEETGGDTELSPVGDRTVDLTTAAVPGSCSAIVLRRRDTQRRFRTRSKERSDAVRSLLLDIQDRLQKVERQRGQLESRSRFLENFLLPHSRPVAGPSYMVPAVALESASRWSKAGHVPDVVKALLLPHIKLTSRAGQAHYVTPHDISLMPLSNFALLYTAAIGQLRDRLKMNSAEANSEELLSCVLEVTTLILSLVMGNPASIRHVARMSMLDGSMSEVDQPQNPEAVLALLAYSESQIQDLLALRRLNWAQLGRLASQRSGLLERMAQNQRHLDRIQIWAEQLQANVAEEHQCYLQHLTAVYLGVNTAWQNAVVTVASYPFLPNYILTEAMAASRGEPSFEALITQQCASREHLTWNHINQYNRMLNVDNVLTNIPFLPSVRQRLFCA